MDSAILDGACPTKQLCRRTGLAAGKGRNNNGLEHFSRLLRVTPGVPSYQKRGDRAESAHAHRPANTCLPILTTQLKNDNTYATALRKVIFWLRLAAYWDANIEHRLFKTFV